MSIGAKIRRVLRRMPPTRAILASCEDRMLLRSLSRSSFELRWELGPRAPQRCVEASRIQLGEELFLFGGYITLGKVSSRLDVFNFQLGKWTRCGKLPSIAAQTHNGVTTDGVRTIFSISGQLGPNCSPVTAACFAVDAITLEWRELPPLVEGRYMPLVHYHNGRIHCLGGSKPDRHSPATDHWSLAVENGRALELEWQRESPLPSARTHTASQLIGDSLFVLGGQKGDVPAIAGSPDYICNFDTPLDEVLEEVFSFNLATKQHKRLAPMPVKLSHTEHTVIQVGSRILIAGGVQDRRTMSDLICVYDVAADQWRELGRLPYPVKSLASAYWNGWLYIIAGQKSNSQTDLRPGQVVDTVWRTRLPQSMIHEDTQ